MARESRVGETWELKSKSPQPALVLVVTTTGESHRVVLLTGPLAGTAVSVHEKGLTSGTLLGSGSLPSSHVR